MAPSSAIDVLQATRLQIVNEIAAFLSGQPQAEQVVMGLIGR